MKPRKLLLVTSGYPYGPGETFITAELPHVARQFGEVEVVPCFYTDEANPRTLPQRVNLAYALRRWGAWRAVHAAVAFVGALFAYRWREDAWHVLTHRHRLENAQEFVRALYRARQFDDFLQRELVDKAREFDLVYFYWLVPEIMGALQFRARTGRPLRIVARAHSGDLYEDQRRGAYYGLRAGIARGIDDIYFVSDHGRAYLQQRYSLVQAKLHTARLGVADPGFLNVQPAEGALSVVSCSFVTPVKRLDRVLDALVHLLARDPALTVRWTHIGDGPLLGELRASVATRLGARAHVIFKGYLQPAQITEVYRHERFDVFVNVSACEGVPVSLMEASAVGIPMVATDVGGNGEIVNSDNGVLVAADADAATIGAALLHFHDRARAVAHRRQARLTLERRFDAPSNFARFGAALLDLVADGATCP